MEHRMVPLVAIVGRPNVGKSSLFNRLIGRRHAITHESAGTTRDANYGSLTWNGRFFMLVDTAGLHKSDGHLELAVQGQVAEVAKLADVLVVVVEAGTILTSEDQRAAKVALKTGKPVILAINKIDAAGEALGDEFAKLGVSTAIQTSAIHGRGTGDLLDAIAEKVPTAQAPPSEPIITLALLGRPNVGKSSLLNSLIGKQKAIVSEQAGTTRDVGSAEIRYHNQSILILDTAGLRRRGKIEAGIEKFSSLRTLAAISNADVCAVIIDATELSVAGDQHIAGLAAEAGKGLMLVVNKWDLVEKDEKTQARYLRKLMRDFAFMPWAPVIFTSATQGLHVTKLFELTQQIAERRQVGITTGSLNRVLDTLIHKQPPAGIKNRRPKLNYATQVGTRPPTFAIFGSNPEMVHFSYARYLENGLREAFDFTGTPIKIEFKSKRRQS